MKRKILVVFLMMVLLLFNIPVYADENNTSETNMNFITYEEYVSLYAENNNMSYEEAKQIVDSDNERILKEYYGIDEVGIQSITYMDSYINGDARIYYVDVYDYLDDGVARIRFGAYGKVLMDAHSRTFINNSWSTYHSLGSGLYTFENVTLSVEQIDYTHVRVFCSGTVEISTSHAYSLGVSIPELLDFGYDQSSNSYWRNYVTDSVIQRP